MRRFLLIAAAASIALAGLAADRSWAEDDETISTDSMEGDSMPEDDIPEDDKIDE